MIARLTAIVLILCSGAAAGAELGRIFFTPAQRATLDNARAKNSRVELGPEKEQTAAPIPPMPQNVSVDGLVRRSDGKDTVWLNNRPVTERSTGGISVSPGKGDRVKLNVRETGRSVDLKVGQSVEIISGTIQEGYSRRPSPKPEAKAAPPAVENAEAAGEKSAMPLQSQPAKPEGATQPQGAMQ